MNYSPEQLANMPLEELENILVQESQKLSDLLAQGGPEVEMLPEQDAEMMAEPDVELAEEEMMEESFEDPAVSPLINPDVPLDMLSPDIIQAATAQLVEAGLLDKASSQMTPELIGILEGVAQQSAPGLYNLTNDDDLMEFVNGIANGTIPVAGIGEPLATAGADELAGADLAGLGAGLPAGPALI